ncbi:MAG: hypothetical protein CL476_07795 [Acidobacteria bacterium]|nr:hypothetical protein [Acidobacteriota bacterium]
MVQRLVQVHGDLRAIGGGVSRGGGGHRPASGANLRRQVARKQHRVGLGQADQAANFIRQLAHVPRPRIEQQVLEGLICELQPTLPLFQGEALQRLLEQRWDLFSSLAQRGDP